ncbi:HlyC/CorC family transporter [Pseudoflavonifractor sp. MSJ-37]|uniref:HlyC/CorC family transporter n=1 Tax=Pseudoflavonifractor sp. MSJ-37 TaxID=2841531 RepID=UPI001C125C5F|nr:hemolysin family protein [Pseudoflavonifractor sp. MSJ-37]MBU5435823.1 hemolysin family protein [Pseudoflavonifractor sp. MSJ-37]
MLDSASIGMIAALVVLVAMSAFFSATETAYTSLNRARMKNRADNGDRRAALALSLSEDYDKLLSTILIGNNIVNNTAATVAAVLFIQLIGALRGPTVSTIVLTVVVLIFGEVSPKSLAKESPEAFASFAAPFLRFLITVLTPLNFLFGQWKRLLSKVFHKQEDSGITEEELVTMVDQAETEGGLDQHESELIRAAIEFNELEVEEILTPRVDIVAVEDTDTMADVAKAFAESGFSRLPVYHEDIDDIIGVIHEKDFHAARYHGQDDISALISNVLYTTGNTKISDLLRVLQKEKAHMVIVVDEYGGTEGLVTLEDIVEELVGEIWDEHDEVIEEFKKQEDGSYLISCTADLSDMFDLFSIKGDCDANTVSGWVMEQVGRVPEAGDHFQADGLDVTVTKVEHRRVLEIRVVVLPKDEEKDNDKDSRRGRRDREEDG